MQNNLTAFCLSYYTLSGHAWAVLAVAFSHDGKILATGSDDKTIKLWDVSTGQEIATLSGHLDSVSTVAISPIAQLIAQRKRRDKTIKWQLVQPTGNSIN